MVFQASMGGSENASFLCKSDVRWEDPQQGRSIRLPGLKGAQEEEGGGVRLREAVGKGETRENNFNWRTYVGKGI